MRITTTYNKTFMKSDDSDDSITLFCFIFDQAPELQRVDHSRPEPIIIKPRTRARRVSNTCRRDHRILLIIIILHSNKLLTLPLIIIIIVWF